MRKSRVGLKTLLSACAIGTLCFAAPALAAPKVVTTIAPVHSITAAIMEGIASPELLIEPSGSPHSNQLRPSQVTSLQDADLIVWIGPDLEVFLDKPIDTLPEASKVLTLAEAEGVTFLPVREGGNWETHDHDAHEDHDHDAHENHEDHEHDATHDHDHEDHDKEAAHEAEAGHVHEHDGHDHDDHHDDPHVWLDPMNAIKMAHAIAHELSEIDPDNKDHYLANETAFVDKLNAVMGDVNAKLEGVSGTSYFVFHDAYQYFENRFGMQATGSITLHPGVNPGAARVDEIRNKLKATKATCLFSEPQFSPKILKVLTEGTEAKVSELDPIGSNLQPGPQLYIELIEYNAKQLSECLKGH